MKKQYLKMNNNDEHLSLGNLFRLIKDASKNKLSALQSELFCILFELETINDTTVNNYCVGCRSIGSEYKQIYLNKQKKYQKKPDEFADNIINLLNIIDGVIHTVMEDKIAFINSSSTALALAKKLFNLAKNDKQVINEFTNKLYILINENKIYECLVEELLFIILTKKQPIYEDELKKEVLETVLNDTSISSLDLQEYLSLKLREGINFDSSMKKLALNNNAYANYELGSNEYYGYVTGTPRYDKAYSYLEKAASLNHASANYIIGNMYIRGLIGSQSNDELQTGYEYLKKSYELGNIAACNLLGNMYLNGIYPLSQDKNMAIKYYKQASSNDFAYAYNNLGSIEEKEGHYDKAFTYYQKAADLGESWACNKVGEYFRQGIIEKDMTKAFTYYNKALESNYKNLCFYAYYNLARYFYLEGYDNIILTKDEKTALEYFAIASHHHILEASIALLYIYADKYLKTRQAHYKDELSHLKKLIETHPKYNNEICSAIEEKLKAIKNKPSLDLSILD